MKVGCSPIALPSPVLAQLSASEEILEMPDTNFQRIPVGGNPRVYGMSAGLNTNLSVSFSGLGSVNMFGNFNEWLRDSQGQTVHQFPANSSYDCVATIQMLVSGNIYPLFIQSQGYNSVKLADSQGTEKVVIAW